MAERTLTPPAMLGRYEVLGQLAVGGMAEILLGRFAGPRGFERTVVLKRILPHLAGVRAFVDMFVDEARIVANIRHQNVVQVYELGHDGDELFLVMEFVEGESLGGLMRRLWTNDRELGHLLAAHVIAEACAGLHAAHELTDPEGIKRNVVHRDVSPQNVMITYAGEVKMLDFGIAKAADRITQTEAGQLKGKYQYMSPEQCRGEPLDRRSDIFSLGTLLYELATSHRLFKRSTDMGTLQAIRELEIPPPSSVSPGIPPSLERVCLKALMRRREDRYQTAAEMRKDLVAVIREVGTGEPLDQLLAASMRAQFADRVAQKQSMLRDVRAGSVGIEIAPAETDLDIDLPVSFDDERVAPQTVSKLSIERKRSRRGTRLALVAIGAMAVTAGALAFAQRMRTAPAAATAPAANDASPADARNAEVTLHVETTPAGARVAVDGREVGTTPVDVSLPRGSDPVAVALRRAGYDPLFQPVVPDVDQRLVLVLRAAAVPAKVPPAKPSRATPRSSGASVPREPKPKASEFPKFD